MTGGLLDTRGFKWRLVDSWLMNKQINAILIFLLTYFLCLVDCFFFSGTFFSGVNLGESWLATGFGLGGSGAKGSGSALLLKNFFGLWTTGTGAGGGFFLGEDEKGSDLIVDGFLAAGAPVLVLLVLNRLPARLKD